MHTNVLHLIEVLLIKAKKQNEQVQPKLIHPVLPIAIFLQRKGKYHETVTHMIILFSRLQEAFREFYLLFDMIILQANPRTEALFAFGQFNDSCTIR